MSDRNPFNDRDSDRTREVDVSRDVDTTGDVDAMRGEGTDVLRRHEEDLQAQTRREQVGEVNVSKRVVEDTQTIDVPVRREEVQITRRPVDDSTGVGSDAFAAGDQTIRVPVMEEQVEVVKTPRVVEEIEVSKTARQETQQVSDTVRREEFDIDTRGDVNTGTRGDTALDAGSRRTAGADTYATTGTGGHDTTRTVDTTGTGGVHGGNVYPDDAATAARDDLNDAGMVGAQEPPTRQLARDELGAEHDPSADSSLDRP